MANAAVRQPLWEKHSWVCRGLLCSLAPGNLLALGHAVSCLARKENEKILGFLSYFSFRLQSEEKLCIYLALGLFPWGIMLQAWCRCTVACSSETPLGLKNAFPAANQSTPENWKHILVQKSLLLSFSSLEL